MDVLKSVFNRLLHLFKPSQSSFAHITCDAPKCCLLQNFCVSYSVLPDNNKDLSQVIGITFLHMS